MISSKRNAKNKKERLLKSRVFKKSKLIMIKKSKKNLRKYQKKFKKSNPRGKTLPSKKKNYKN